MPLPSKQTERTRNQAATIALLRFFVASLALGYVQLLATVANAGVLFEVPPGGRPPFDLFGNLELGATWIYVFSAIVALAVLLKAVILGAAVRFRGRPLDAPWIWSLVGLGGLLASGGSMAISIALPMLFATRTELEQVAAMSISFSVAASVGQGLDWLMRLAILIALLVVALRSFAPETREGPYREPAA